jgi:Protein of unknown function (DUF2637)
VLLRPAAPNIRTEYLLGNCAGGSGDLQLWLAFFCLALVTAYVNDASRGGRGVRAWRRCPVTVADRVIRWSIAGAMLGVAAVAAVVSYEHASALVRAHGEPGWLTPLMVVGPIYPSSMVMLDSARRKTPVPALARWLLGLSIAATLAANVAHGLGMDLLVWRWQHGRLLRWSAPTNCS